TITDNKVTYTIAEGDIQHGQDIVVKATIEDGAGNVSDEGKDDAQVDLETASENAAPSVLIESGDDNIINAEEAKGGVEVTITLPAGTNPASDTLHLDINGTKVELKLSE
ncbi:TPA: hypothetical protein RZA59_004291, partial [Vibrio vulnificus]|nr:hypothetical protein [Vibrio vulnificus]HEB2779538.1 hypothetical protein [Vibrio vulnificus]